MLPLAVLLLGPCSGSARSASRRRRTTSAAAKTAAAQGRHEVPAPDRRGSKQLKTYTANQADIIPAPAACPKMLSPTSSGKGITSITVNMLGVAEQPDPADADGKGTATFRLRQGEGQVCYSLTVSGVGLSTDGPTSITFPPASWTPQRQQDHLAQPDPNSWDARWARRSSRSTAIC